MKKKAIMLDRDAAYKIIKDLKEGDTFVDHDGYRCHVLVNLEKEQRIVFKYYGKNKQWWHYFVESYYWFELRLRTNEGGETVGGKKAMKIKKAPEAKSN